MSVSWWTLERYHLGEASAEEAAQVRAALETTANQRGSVNKTRAALYLGWDPDTLTSRMSDLGLNLGAVASSSEAAPPPA